MSLRHLTGAGGSVSNRGTDFTTGLRVFNVGGRSYGNPRHTGCQLAKLWGGSGFVEGGEWRSSFTEVCRDPKW